MEKLVDFTSLDEAFRRFRPLMEMREHDMEPVPDGHGSADASRTEAKAAKNSFPPKTDKPGIAQSKPNS